MADRTTESPAPRVTRGRALRVAGEEIVLLPERAAWWPARRTLVVADLHLGKESTFRAAGIPIPDGVLDEALARLARIADACGAERVVVAGDLVHARRGLTPDVVERVAAWRATFAGRIELVDGNHERGVTIPAAWRIDRRPAYEADGPFAYAHEPPATQSDGLGPACGYRWCGHLHPTVRVGRTALPAFVIARDHAILPAFTAFARGVATWSDASTDGSTDAPTGRRVYAVVEGNVVEIPPRA
ncbi:MAG: ligase-associated DNA damage response endonuclease PdeM [Phycisphaerae bacterium]|nr:ligase-associated DNA damage response endonuclease PdeM [Phycisphaerae bacterium]